MKEKGQRVNLFKKFNQSQFYLFSSQLLFLDPPFILFVGWMVAGNYYFLPIQ